MSETYATYRVWDGCKAPVNLEYSGRLIGQIVRESTIDRDALLELVKELELGAQCAVGRKWSNVECERMAKHLADDYETIARRIRKALGVES